MASIVASSFRDKAAQPVLLLTMSRRKRHQVPAISLSTQIERDTPHRQTQRGLEVIRTRKEPDSSRVKDPLQPTDADVRNSLT